MSTAANYAPYIHGSMLTPPMYYGQQAEASEVFEFMDMDGANSSSDFLGNDMIAVSTSFTPKGDPETDTVLLSSDNVYFYISYKIVLDAAPNAFFSRLVAPLSDPIYRINLITLDAPAAVLNIIFHALYNTSPVPNNPSFETIVLSIDCMPIYGLFPQHLIKPQTPLYDLILSYAPLYPLDTYALAAHHDIADMASMVSTHLLSYDLTTVSDEMVERIGAVYLKKLMLLHSTRVKALRDIVLEAPVPHPETDDCSFADQREQTRAWALVSAHLAWDVKPDISTHALSTTLNPVLGHISCKVCEQYLRDKIKNVIVRWNDIKRTI